MSKRVSAPDRALIDQARAGVAVAREELAQRVGKTAYVFALQLTGGSDTAHDVAQDSVMRFFKHLDRFDTSRAVAPWLYQIVRNQVRDQYRREQQRRHLSLETWLEVGHREMPDPKADPEGEVERQDLRQRVWRAIALLPDTQREIIVLRDYHDLSYRELSEALAIPQGTVMSRLHAARKRLREILVAESGLGKEDT